MNRLSKTILLSMLIMPSVLLTACSSNPLKTMGVNAWERDILARPAMQPDAAPLDTAYDEHIYFSKEAASGGRGFGGGGCGCN